MNDPAARTLRATGERIAQDERLTPATNDRNRWLALVALTIGVAMIIVDATIVNVAIPSIIRDLHIGITQAEWANSIYSLVFAALLISVGRIGDVTGRRRVFISGLLVFLGASLITALAPSGTVLLAGRFLQGVGGALILPSTLSIVNATFRGRERAIAFGIWGSVIGGMAALGPLAGGWFVTNLSWRWAFYVNLPVGALALAGALLFVGESRDPDARPGFDPPGVALSTIGFLGVVFGLIEGQTYGWWTAQRDFLGLSPGGLLGDPVRVRARRALARGLRPRRAAARAGGASGARRLLALPDPDLPLRERRGPDRRARRARARVRDPALPAVGARALGLRHRARAGRSRRRSVPRGRARGAAHRAESGRTGSCSSVSRSRSSASSPSASRSPPTARPGSSARSSSSTGSASASRPRS